MAPAPAVTVAPPDPVIEHVVSTPTVPVIEYVTPVLVTDFVTLPARVIQYVTPAPVSSICGLANLQFSTGLGNPQFSTNCVEVSAPEALGSLLAAPATQAHQEHFVVGETQNIVEFHPVQEQLTAEEIPERQVIERIQEQIEEQIGDFPIPRITAAHAAPSPVNEYVVPESVVNFYSACSSDERHFARVCCFV